MDKSFITSKNAFSILFVMILGNYLLLGSPFNAKQDSWISILVTFAIMIPVTLIFSRLMKLYPEKNLFYMFFDAFGKAGGIIATVIFSLYAVLASAIVVQNYSRFFKIISLTNTPFIIITAGIVFAAIYLAKSGDSTLGKWSFAIIILLFLLIATAFLMTSQEYNFDNLFPVFSNGFDNIFAGSISLLAMAFGDIVLFLTLGDSIKKSSSSYKIFLSSIIITIVLMLLVFLKNLCVLGQSTMEITMFPSYAAARMASLSVFFERVEAVISYYFVIAGITKISVCIIAAAKGSAKILKIHEYKKTVMPVGLVVFAASMMLFDNTAQMFDFVNKYPYISLPLQIGVPILLWIIAEIKHAVKERPMPSMNKIIEG